MYCGSCGSFVKDGQTYCSNCGAPVSAQNAQPVTQPVQTVYQQPAAGQQVPAPKSGKTYGPQERKKANRLCILSLILAVGAPLVITILFEMAENLGLGSNYFVVGLGVVIGILIACSVIAGIALMIVVRVKYTRSKFGLILMIIYCAYVAAAILFLLFALSSCSDFIGSSSCS